MKKWGTWDLSLPEVVHSGWVFTSRKRQCPYQERGQHIYKLLLSSLIRLQWEEVHFCSATFPVVIWEKFLHYSTVSSWCGSARKTGDVTSGGWSLLGLVPLTPSVIVLLQKGVALSDKCQGQPVAKTVVSTSRREQDARCEVIWQRGESSKAEIGVCEAVHSFQDWVCGTFLHLAIYSPQVRLGALMYGVVLVSGKVLDLCFLPSNGIRPGEILHQNPTLS